MLIDAHHIVALLTIIVYHIYFGITCCYPSIMNFINMLIDNGEQRLDNILTFII